MMDNFRVVKAILPALAVLFSGCVGGTDGGAEPNATPPPTILSQQAVLGNRRPPIEVRPGVHYFSGKQPYIMIVLVKGNLNTPEEKRTPKGAVSYKLEARQDGERDKDDNLVTPAMGITETLRLHTPHGVPVLVRMWLATNNPKYAWEQVLGGTLYKTKSDVYEDVWVQGPGEQVLTWRTGP